MQENKHKNDEEKFKGVEHICCVSGHEIHRNHPSLPMRDETFFNTLSEEF